MITLNPSGGKIPKQEPPKVLITLAMIRQMAERKRQLEALRKMIAERENRNDG